MPPNFSYHPIEFTSLRNIVETISLKTNYFQITHTHPHVQYIYVQCMHYYMAQ